MIEVVLQKAINQFLKLSPEADDLLKPLIGKTLALEVLGINLTLYFVFQSDAIVVTKTFDGEVAATISGFPFSLISMMTSKNVKGSGIKVQGEAEAAEALKDLLANLNIDWEEQLSHLTGDLVAHHAGNLGRGLLSGLANLKESVSNNLGEYLTEEKNIVIPEAELEVFYNEVDEFNLGVERLAVRIKKLEKQRENS